MTTRTQLQEYSDEALMAFAESVDDPLVQELLGRWQQVEEHYHERDLDPLDGF